MRKYGAEFFGIFWFVLAGLSALWPMRVLAQHDHMTNMQMTGESAAGEPMAMSAMYGDYSMNRESSGTSWQPGSSEMTGRHFTLDSWECMLHGSGNIVYDHQGGRRGKEKTFSSSMAGFMAAKDLSRQRVGVRTMFSLDPLMGKKGYPLLLQTGETYDGVHPLIDYQHPHDFFAELAATYSYQTAEKQSAYVYAGLPGEPALGPPAFMHRFSGMEIPEAPLTHHWLDSTHITFGVVTAGYVWDKFKLEGSVFRGREPDERRWDIERPTLDSYSVRVFFNPTDDLSLQISRGALDSPEQLEPSTDIDRTTFSCSYNRPLMNGQWQTTAAWGRNNKKPGDSTDAYLLETSLNVKKTHTFMSRFEHVRKDELFEEDHPLHGKAYTVKKLTLGYIFDFPALRYVQAGVGTSVSAHFLPEPLEEVYSDTPVSFMVFTRLKL